MCESRPSHFSCVRLFAISLTVACHALQFMGFSRTDLLLPTVLIEVHEKSKNSKPTSSKDGTGIETEYSQFIKKYFCIYGFKLKFLNFNVLHFAGVLSPFSHVQLFGIPWTVAHQAPQSMRFSRQEYSSGLSFPSPRDLPSPWIEPRDQTLIPCISCIVR